MSSLVDYAVLGLLIERPSYGYEVGARFERRFGDFLDSSQSNIYAVIQRLEAAGLIEKMIPAAGLGSEGRPRLHFRATAQGAVAYRGWLAERIRDDSQRSELFSRLASTGVRRVDAMLEVIDSYERECLAEAQRVRGPAGARSLAEGNAMSELIEDLIREERRRALDAQHAWIAYARARILAYAKQRTPDGEG